MARLIVHVEGKTEEVFVNELLAPHLYEHGFTSVTARGMGNSRQRDKRQGVKSWPEVRKAICNILIEDSKSYATLMVDYYAMPDENWPGRREANSLSHALKANHIEKKLHRTIQSENSSIARRFLPYVLMHEFEALLFSDCEQFAHGIGCAYLNANLQAIREQYDTPEHINDSAQTAPSKRILKLLPAYRKPIYGNLAALEIGLATMRRECYGFNQWITRLEQIGASAQ
jgi:hypothetical protein